MGTGDKAPETTDRDTFASQREEPGAVGGLLAAIASDPPAPCKKAESATQPPKLCADKRHTLL